MKKYLAVLVLVFVAGCNESQKAVSPDCYDLGYRYGRCATLAMYGYKYPPDDNFVMPVECRGTEAAHRGINAGVKSVNKEKVVSP